MVTGDNFLHFIVSLDGCVSEPYKSLVIVISHPTLQLAAGH